MIPIEPGTPDGGDEDSEEEGKDYDDTDEMPDFPLKGCLGWSTFGGELGNAPEDCLASRLNDQPWTVSIL